LQNEVALTKVECLQAADEPGKTLFIHPYCSAHLILPAHSSPEEAPVIEIRPAVSQDRRTGNDIAHPSGRDVFMKEFMGMI